MILAGGMLYAEKPGSKLKINFIERFRFVSWDNSVNLTDEDHAVTFTRHRTSVDFRWTPSGNMEFRLKLTNEFRKYLSPKFIGFNMHEVIFDQLYFKWDKAFNLPLTLTLGRQNIMLGEGFVVMDGHPLDGSRSIYFNAVRADMELAKNHTLTLFATYQPETDDLLPVINEREQGLVLQPEKGLGLYYVGKFSKTRVDGYVVRKDVDANDDYPVESGINTLGARVNMPLGKQWAFTVEGSYQFGSYGDDDRSAMGGYFHLDYSFDKDLPLLHSLTVGGIYLSGDDPATPEREGWDPVFSRWPKWSESYIYTLIREGGVAYWSNFNSIYVALTLKITDPMKLRLTWHKMGANEEDYTDYGFLGGIGKNRGDLIIGRLDFRVNKYTTGHFVWEHFRPGDFYFDNAKNANWLRFELLFKI